MIRITTLSGDEMYLNCDHIETIAETPDTVITLANGRKYLVMDTAGVLIGRMVQYRTRMGADDPVEGATRQAFTKTSPPKFALLTA